MVIFCLRAAFLIFWSMGKSKLSFTNTFFDFADDCFIFFGGEGYVGYLGVDVGDKDFGDGYFELGSEFLELSVGEFVYVEAGVGFIWVSSVRHEMMIRCYNTKVKRKVKKVEKSLEWACGEWVEVVGWGYYGTLGNERARAG